MSHVNLSGVSGYHFGMAEEQQSCLQDKKGGCADSLITTGGPGTAVLFNLTRVQVDLVTGFRMT